MMLDSQDKFVTDPESVRSLIFKRNLRSISSNLEVYRVSLHKISSDINNQVHLYEFGSKSQSHTTSEKVLLLLGEAGAGKTTLINFMVNYVFGVAFKDPFRFRIADSFSGTQKKGSTPSITSYTLHHQNYFRIPYTLTIIDTEGLSASDRRVLEILQQLLGPSESGGIKHISAVGIVAKSTLVRLSPEQENLLQQIKSLVGDDHEHKLSLFLTFSDGQSSQALAAIKNAGVKYKRSFQFNNCSLYTNKTLAVEGEDDSDEDVESEDDSDEDVESEDDSDEDDNYDEIFWQIGIRSCKNIFDDLRNYENSSSSLIYECLNKAKECSMGQQINTTNSIVFSNVGSDLLTTVEDARLRLESHRLRKPRNLMVYNMGLKNIPTKSDSGLKFEFGSKQTNSPEKILLLVGMTSSGKTRLINAMVNHIFGVQWKDSCRFRLFTGQHPGEWEQEHHTTTVTSYTLHHQEWFSIPFTITIIDTPGISETNEKPVHQQILQFLSCHGVRGTNENDTVGFVLPASLAKLSSVHMQMFKDFEIIFQKAQKVLLLTFSDYRRPQAVSATHRGGVSCQLYYKFNNSSLYTEKAVPRMDKKAELEENNMNEMFWNIGVKGFKDLFQQMSEAKTNVTPLQRETAIWNDPSQENKIAYKAISESAFLSEESQVMAKKRLKRHYTSSDITTKI